TGRDKIMKFSGHYHGHADSLLAAGGSGVANQGISGSAGVPKSAVADTIVAPWNELPELDESIAALILEPLPANMGIVPPSPNFLLELRKACDSKGVLLIFDEVITGFRLSKGGASQWYGVQPDLWCFGKVIGGGLPMGAYAGTKEIMSNIAPLGDVYQAGTLSGNPIATAAGIAQLHILNNDAAYGALTDSARNLSDGLSEIFKNAGIEAVVPRVGTLLSIFFTKSKPINFDEAQSAAENGIYAKFFHGMLKRGVALAPGPYEALFPSLAHTKDVIEKTLEIAEETISEIVQK
ncbi:MAG: aminotransferase class III-fold pyridoxal phosphate-dependent enzyme, partial [Actinomycetota bacterium]|nr:aminotransferase class III-fold pyridoxal phosphate-dependent enzyme [Actinomycetota bacterium]